MYLQTERKIIRNGVTVNSQNNMGAFTSKPGWANTNDSLALISIICRLKYLLWWWEQKWVQIRGWKQQVVKLGKGQQWAALSGHFDQHPD